jgi:hypothetical protein
LDPLNPALKFVITMENTNAPGYISEKIVNAALANAGEWAASN